WRAWTSSITSRSSCRRSRPSRSAGRRQAVRRGRRRGAPKRSGPRPPRSGGRSRLPGSAGRAGGDPAMARAYLAISIVTVLWATNFTVAKFATKEFDPFFIASFRVFVTSAIFYACLPKEQKKFDLKDFKAIVPLSLSGILGNHVLFASGIKYTTPSH